MSADEAKTCSQCNTTKKLTEFTKDARSKSGYSSLCKECNKNKSKSWRDQNPQKSRESVKEYKENNPEKVKSMYLDWAKRNPERVRELARRNYRNHRDNYREYARNYRKSHRQQLSQNSKNWSERNPEKVKNNQRKWAHTHPSEVRLKAHKRNAKKAGNGGTIKLQEWMKVIQKYEYKCLCCGRDDKPLTMDHVIPISRGGKNVISNIQPLCQSCNSRKGRKIIDFR